MPQRSQASIEEYTKTYSTFSGCDIVATFNGKIIGELQAITYSISREKAPVFSMGSPEPRSFSRGKRGIAGSLVFHVFSRDALIEEFTPMLSGEDNVKNRGIQKFKMNTMDSPYIPIEDWDAGMTEASGFSDNGKVTNSKTPSDLVTKVAPKYADEILPFDITVTFANEYGQKAMLVIYGVELLNEGSGYSVDSVVAEKAYTFVARRIDAMKTLDKDNEGNFASSW